MSEVQLCFGAALRALKCRRAWGRVGGTVLKYKQFFKLLFQGIIVAPLVNKGTRDLFANAVGPSEAKAVCLMWKQRSPRVRDALSCFICSECNVLYSEWGTRCSVC